MMRFLTAGESHGPQLTAIVEGMPAGFRIDPARINHELARRQKGYGRGGRMAIERDEVRITSGARFGQSMGSPITMVVDNLDYKNWLKRMSIDPRDRNESRPVTRPRPGHADLAGVLKYNLDDIRDILERASARETTARVAIGALARQILDPFGIDVLGYVVSIGAIRAGTPDLPLSELRRITEESQVRVTDPQAERAIIEEIDACKKTGDTLGGVVEVTATTSNGTANSTRVWPLRCSVCRPAKASSSGWALAPPPSAAPNCMTKSAMTLPHASSRAFPIIPAAPRAG